MSTSANDRTVCGSSVGAALASVEAKISNQPPKTVADWMAKLKAKAGSITTDLLDDLDIEGLTEATVYTDVTPDGKELVVMLYGRR